MDVSEGNKSLNVKILQLSRIETAIQCEHCKNLVVFSLRPEQNDKHRFLGYRQCITCSTCHSLVLLEVAIAGKNTSEKEIEKHGITKNDTTIPL